MTPYICPENIEMAISLLLEMPTRFLQNKLNHADRFVRCSDEETLTTYLIAVSREMHNRRVTAWAPK